MTVFDAQRTILVSWILKRVKERLLIVLPFLTIATLLLVQKQREHVSSLLSSMDNPVLVSISVRRTSNVKPVFAPEEFPETVTSSILNARWEYVTIPRVNAWPSLFQITHNVSWIQIFATDKSFVLRVIVFMETLLLSLKAGNVIITFAIL